MSDLKPCPFCGDIPKLTIWNPSDGQHRDYASGVWIASIKSDFVEIEKSSWESEEDARNKAIKAWNQRPSQWQDISTAPRDGTEILVYSQWDWNEMDDPSEDYYIEKASYMWRGFYAYESIAVNPTHWMPLPEAPKELSETLPPKGGE